MGIQPSAFTVAAYKIPNPLSYMYVATGLSNGNIQYNGHIAAGGLTVIYATEMQTVRHFVTHYGHCHPPLLPAVQEIGATVHSALW